MASPHLLLPCMLLSLFLSLFSAVFAADASIRSALVNPLSCSAKIMTCNASLYHINIDLKVEEIATLYTVNPSEIRPIKHNKKQDYLISVPCSCKNISGTVGYFYDTTYKVKQFDTFYNVSTKIYSGQPLYIEEEIPQFKTDADFPIHLPCGCVQSQSQIVVTYTVQEHDTLSDIGTLLSAKIENIEKMNKNMTENPSYIVVGWVLFVPMEKNGLRTSKPGFRHKWSILVAILLAVTLLSISTLIFILYRRRKPEQNVEVPDKPVSTSLKSSKSSAPHRSLSLHNQLLHKENMGDVAIFESDGLVIFSLEEIEEATGYFDETKKIGEGGYGSVFLGVIRGKEVAIKKMKSNSTKEFFAELKVLCKIHHINVVELLGYASGDDHLYLVYEYVQNGSLSEHLHDPLLKGHQPLSWTARTQIAVDAAKGIEYIHDHTKARYVHRDIKTSNILLDEGFRAKVADFGLAKLVGRTNEEDVFATRLVGTPGYLPPESVKELQVTHKTDVFAFGVVLAELITGQRALFRDNREPGKMKSLITVIKKVFQDDHPEAALEAATDGNLRSNYPMEDMFKMAEIAEWCMSEEAVERPEMREIVVMLSQIATSSIEWEATLGGNSQIASSCCNRRSDLMAGAVSALFLLDIKGRVLIWRDYRGDVSAAQAERFFTKLIEKEVDPESHDPVVHDNGVSYLFIQHNNVYLMAASRQNCNAASLLFFLHRIVDVFKHYFEELEEESLRDNFVVVYELLDEMMDFGYPQYTEAKILSEFIKTDAYRMEVTQRPPMAVTNAVSWRSEGIRYKKNEVFLDVVESVNILVNSNGQIIRSDVVGALKMRTYLSGMPECKLGLNDRVLLEAQGRATKGKAIDLEDIKFHQCVRLARFENDRTISFVPPDGAFDLMTYRLSTQVKPLIWVECQIERHSKSRIEILVKARSQFKERSTATNVEIEVPVVSDATNPDVRTSLGSAAYAPESDALIWKIRSFPGGKEYMLRAEFRLPSVTAEESTPERKAPIRVKFEIPYFTVSGIQVRYLKIIEKSGYQALPWVRYITMAGEYELRLV
ncbi:hypothetical protein ACFX15_020720 [Malus domestica]|uniref:Protein kinase domain-containing protein n=5 Tax=Magnoliopsida TaxID=3398 RepID=A0A498HRP9_MALDO|nr:hypothetical protein DVH24_033675 [Malus domestica]